MEWISKADRLPPADEHVLIAGPKGVTLGYREGTGVGADDGHCWVDLTEWLGEESIPSNYPVTHWMPLPAAPKLS